MTGQIRNSRHERELDSYVESPSRPNKTAQEVVVANAITVSTDGLATAAKQDEQTSLLTSINNKVATEAKQDTQITLLNSIGLVLSNILTAITGVLNIRFLNFTNDKVDVTGSSVNVGNFPATQNVNVTASVLPTGASTSALQTSGNSILSSILSAIQGVLNIRSLVFATDKVDVSGSTITANIGTVAKKRTYGVAIAGFQFAAAGTDIFTIAGVTGKRIRIKHISINGVQQNISSLAVVLVKRSTQNTGGTFVNLTPVPFDSNFAASLADVRYYTANPTTLGTLVGNIQTERVVVGSASGSNASGDDLKFSFGMEDESEIVLNNSNEVIAINMNGVTASQNLMNIDAVFTEEDV